MYNRDMRCDWVEKIEALLSGGLLNCVSVDLCSYTARFGLVHLSVCVLVVGKIVVENGLFTLYNYVV